MKRKYHIYDSYGVYITTRDSYKAAFEFVYSRGAYGKWIIKDYNIN